jgi:hypothetical protein
MKKLSLKNLIGRIQSVALRFPFTLFFVIGFTFFLLIQINQLSKNHHEQYWTFFSLGILLSLSVTLFSEGFKNLYKIGLNLLAIILLLLFCYLLPEKFLPIHFYKVISIGIVLFLTTFIVSFFKKGNDIPFWEFSKESIIQLFISVIFAQILMAGLSLAVLSLKELFKMNIDGKVFGDISVITYVLFGGIYFLANVPDKTEKYKQIYNFNKFLKVLGLYILLPILAIYSLILYVYLAQIMVKWQLPNGYVSTLVSVLGLGGFLTMLILFPLRIEKNKVTIFFSKYFPILLLPLLILMSVGIFRRLGDYGMTINRLYVLILNIWLYGICLYIFVSRARHLKWIVISFATVLLISSVGPWSVYHVTKRSMLKEIGQMLSESRLLKDGKVIDNQDKSIKLDPKVSDQLSEDIKYISNNYGIEKLQSFFSQSIKNETLSEISKLLGISNLPVKNTNFNVWLERKGTSALNTENYKSFLYLPSFWNRKNDTILTNNQMYILLKNSNLLVISKKGQFSPFTIPLKPKLKEIIQTQKTKSSFSIEEMTITTNNCKLLLNSVSGNYYAQNDSVHINNCDALLFLK